MNKYYETTINNSLVFLEEQKQKHKDIKDIDVDVVNEKCENLNSEIMKSDELINSLEPISNSIEEISVKLKNKLIASFKSFKDYLIEVGEESIDFTFMEDARKRLVNDFNNKIDNLSKSFFDALEDPLIFIDAKVEVIDNYIIIFKNFSEQIDEYINFLKEKKENIVEILQKESKIKNKIDLFKNQEFNKFPSHQSIIDLEEQVEKISSLEISKLLDELKKERNETSDNEVEDKDV